MPEKLQRSRENENAERKIPDCHPLTPEIIGRLLKLLNEPENIVEYIDVVTADGDPRRITRHPTNEFLLKIVSPNFTKNLDPYDSDIYPSKSNIYKGLFILDDTLAKVS